MAAIGADGLSLLIGDGATTEVFSPLKGATISKLELTQKSNVAAAVAGHAWLTHVESSARRAMVECDAYATDEAAAMRLRELMLSGEVGNFKLELSVAKTLIFSAVVTLYRETIEAGDIKKLMCRLDSSGAVNVV